MPWLEVPEWRSWQSYAAPMTDIEPPAEHPFTRGDEHVGAVRPTTPFVEADDDDGVAPPEEVIGTITINVDPVSFAVLDEPEVADVDAAPDTPVVSLDVEHIMPQGVIAPEPPEMIFVGLDWIDDEAAARAEYKRTHSRSHRLRHPFGS